MTLAHMTNLIKLMLMKRINCIILCLLLVISLQAQTNHLKFMGIPLNGTIEQFQSKLKLKGITPDNNLNRISQGEPFRFYKGTFAGEKATIKIKYNSKTKIVWGAMVTIEYRNNDLAESQLEYYKKKLLEKYPDSIGGDEEKEGIPCYMLGVGDGNDLIGFIYLYTRTSSNTIDNNVYLILNYKDYSNTKKNERENLEDL